MSEERYSKHTERPASICIFEAASGRDPGDAVKQEATEQLRRFINDTINHKEPAEGDKQAAADALIAVMGGIDLQNILGLKRKPGQHGGTINPDRVYIDDPLFEVVRKLVAREIKSREAKDAFYEIVRDRTGEELDDRTIQRYIKQIKPRAGKVHNALAAIFNKNDKS